VTTPGRRPLVVVTGRRRPHQLLILAASVFVGGVYLAGVPVPPSVDAMLRPGGAMLWAAALAASGALGLAGSWLCRDVERGLLLESAAMLINAAAIGLYAVAMFAHNATNAITAGTFCALLAAADVWRAWQAHADVDELRSEAGRA
jgi:hypothetical protein